MFVGCDRPMWRLRPSLSVNWLRSDARLRAAGVGETSRGLLRERLSCTPCAPVIIGGETFGFDGRLSDRSRSVSGCSVNFSRAQPLAEAEQIDPKPSWTCDVSKGTH